MKLMVYVDSQRMDVLDDVGARLQSYPVSTGAKGVGERRGSYQTPRGRHIVRAKIGQHAPEGAVFVGRRQTGELCTPEAYLANKTRDWILTRIFWLSGLEPGKNRLGEVDTFRRYIYIHGTPDAVELGKPGSRGCIRMRNQDIVKLFEHIPVGTEVEILEHEPA